LLVTLLLCIFTPCFHLGAFSIIQSTFFKRWLLKTIGFVAKPTNHRIDNKLLKLTYHITLPKSKNESKHLAYLFLQFFIVIQFINLFFLRRYGLCKGHPHGFFWFFSGDALFEECFVTSSCEHFRRFGKVFLCLSPNLVKFQTLRWWVTFSAILPLCTQGTNSSLCDKIIYYCL
jgi:hypothetical protein